MNHWKVAVASVCLTLAFATTTGGCRSSKADAASISAEENALNETASSGTGTSDSIDTKPTKEETGKTKKRVFKAFEVNPDEPCDHCEKRFCTRLNGQNFVTNCYDGDRGDICRGIVECAAKSNCAKRLSADCYCGEGVAISQCIGHGGKGPCRQEIEAGSLTEDPSEIAVRFADPKYPVGRAMALIDCKRSYCPKCNE